jgi:hypothetical protein
MLSCRCSRMGIWASFFIFVLVNISAAQESNFGSPLSDLIPSSLFAAFSPNPQLTGSEAVQISGLTLRDFPQKIPNLEFGFSYLFGKNLRQRFWSVDYLLPLLARSKDVFFWELHGNFLSYKPANGVLITNNLRGLGSPDAHSRTDLSLGSGYRRMIQPDVMFGINSFSDATYFFETWRTSSSLGLEFAANATGNSAFDLNFNYYTTIYGDFNSRGGVYPYSNFVNEFRKGQGSFDLEAGYSLPVLDSSMDLRIKFTGYQFNFNNRSESGWKTGGELTTADGVFRLSAEFGRDRIFGTYGIVGGYIDVGLQLENLLQGKNPFRLPEFVFKSPRNMVRLLTRPVKRNWIKPSSQVSNATSESNP